MPVKSLADGHTKLAILPIAPTDPQALTVTELESALDASCRITKNNYTLGPVASETFADPALCDTTNANAFGASNFEANFSVFRYYDEATKQIDETGDEVYQALKTKGQLVWLVERESLKASTEPWAADDLVSIYLALLDHPQKPSERSGYIKNVIVPQIQDAYLDVALVGAGV